MSTTIYLALSAVVYFAVLAALIRRRRDEELAFLKTVFVVSQE